MCVFDNTYNIALEPHLFTKQPFPLLQSANDSCPGNGKGPLHIFLYFSVGVTHLGNEQVQQDCNHQKQEDQIQDNREPPGEEEGGRGGSLKGAGQDQMMSLQAHSLVANVLPFIIISKVVTIEDVSSLNQNSDTGEHHMPRVPAQDGTTCITLLPWEPTYTVCICTCMCASHPELTGSVVQTRPDLI